MCNYTCGGYAPTYVPCNSQVVCGSTAVTLPAAVEETGGRPSLCFILVLFILLALICNASCGAGSDDEDEDYCECECDCY